MNTPAVSIILPTQGTRGSLAAALRSALTQDAVSFEVVLVDDSVGNTAWLADPEVEPLLADTRVRRIPFHASRGCAAAKNAGLGAARGEWVCYLDDDNVYQPEKVSAQLAEATVSECPVILCGLEIVVRGRRRRRQVGVKRFSGDALLLDAVADTNVLFHRREGAPVWDEDLGTADDACYFQSLLDRYRLDTVPNVPRSLVVYHAHSGTRANRDKVRVLRGMRRLVVRWSRRYGPQARRTLLLRSLVTLTKFRSDGWCRWAVLGTALIRSGGWREWRFVANAALVKLPFLRRWAVT